MRLLLPLLSVAIAAAIGVAIVSYWLGDRWARQQIASRFDAIARTLPDESFPLNRQIVALLAQLTGTDLITLDADGRVVESSIRLTGRTNVQDLQKTSQSSDAQFTAGSTPRPDALIALAGRHYRYAMFDRSGIAEPNDQASQVVVLFDEDDLHRSRLRAAGLPLATGMSTIVLLASVTLWLAGRLIGRVTTLQQEVDQIADGDFDAAIQCSPCDEIGRLGAAVDHMRRQLKQTWNTIHLQQSQKLLHQLAGGLAHQLRNSITGARMAVELHERRCDSRDDDSLGVALSQLEQTDDYVRRLLLVATGKQDEDRPGAAAQCLQDIRASLSATANHLHVDLTWNVTDELRQQQVPDTPSLASAVTNLVLNAMQVAGQVEVKVTITDSDELKIAVIDDGPGPPEAIAENVFDPFVTSKPEGLGLGLPLVKRSAQRLGGRVEWRRLEGKTHFVMFASIQ